jgi:hypothetical protein
MPDHRLRCALLPSSKASYSADCPRTSTPHANRQHSGVNYHAVAPASLVRRANAASGHRAAGVARRLVDQQGCDGTDEAQLARWERSFNRQLPKQFRDAEGRATSPVV